MYNNLLSQWFKPNASSVGQLELSSTVCVRMQLQGILHVGYSFNLLFDNHLATI